MKLQTSERASIRTVDNVLLRQPQSQPVRLCDPVRRRQALVEGRGVPRGSSRSARRGGIHDAVSGAERPLQVPSHYQQDSRDHDECLERSA